MTIAEKELFIDLFNQLSAVALQTAEAKGWHDERVLYMPELIALMHSELSEALEAFRNSNPPDKNVPEFRSIEVELADCIIRIMHASAHLGHDVAGALLQKMDFNKTRKYRHGDKRA